MNALNALNKLNELAFSFYTAGAFSAACKLRLFDCLGEEGLTCEEVSSKLDIHNQACHRLLMAMEHLGVVKLDNDRFSCSQMGLYLTKAHPTPMWFTQDNNYFYHMWEYLPDALKENSPRHEQAWGKTAEELYAAIYDDENALRQFFKLLDSYNWPIGQETARRLDLSKCNKVLDVAGGTGMYAAMLLKEYDNLSGVCLDLQPVKQPCEEMIEHQDLGGRFEFLVGDMFENSYPTDCDVMLLSYILHNWNDERCLTILKNCYDALPSGGMLVVSEKVLNEQGGGNWWGTMMNLQMLIAFQPGAKERTFGEYQALLSEVGFKDITLHTLDAPRDIVVAYKG